MTDDIVVDVESDAGIAVNVGLGGLMPGERAKLNSDEGEAERSADTLRVITSCSAQDWGAWSRVGTSSYKVLGLTFVPAEALVGQGYLDFHVTMDLANPGGGGDETVSFQLITRLDRDTHPINYADIAGTTDSDNFGLPTSWASPICTFVSKVVAASTAGRLVLSVRVAFEGFDGTNYTQTISAKMLQDDASAGVKTTEYIYTSTIDPTYARDFSMQFKFSEAPAGGQKANVISYQVNAVGERDLYKGL